MANIKEGTPARYHLATEAGAIQIAVNKSVMPKAADFPSKDTAFIRQDLDLTDPFTPPSADRPWGYGEIVKQVEQPNSEWVLFQVGLPVVENAYDPKGFAVAATLGLIFECLNNTERVSTAIQPQYSQVSLVNSIGWPAANPMYVRIFQPFMDWIQGVCSDRDQETVTDAMRDAYAAIHRDEDTTFWDYTTKFKFTKGGSGINMYFHPPGDATSLGYHQETKTEVIQGANGSLQRGETHTEHLFTPKNVDNVDSQLTLLAGVAKLEELATGAYFKNP